MNDDETLNQTGQTAALPVFLIVDDSRLMRVAIKKMLKSHCELIEAADGEEGWDKLRAHDQIQGVFSDLLMPKLDGLELLDRLRASGDPRLETVPFVLVTGKESDADGLSQDVRKRGGQGVIGKPFNSTDVLEALHAMLDSTDAATETEAHPQQTEAELQAQREQAEEQARQEAALAAQRAAEELARKEAEAQAQREQQERARIAEAARLREQAEREARRLAAQQAAEEQARREAALAAQRAAEEQARREAAEEAKRQAEERAAAEREAAERARQQAEELARQMAEEKAQREADEKARLEAERAARRRAEQLARRFGPVMARLVGLILPLLRLSERLTGKPGKDKIADLYQRSRRD